MYINNFHDYYTNILHIGNVQGNINKNAYTNTKNNKPYNFQLTQPQPRKIKEKLRKNKSYYANMTLQYTPHIVLHYFCITVADSKG